MLDKQFVFTILLSASISLVNGQAPDLPIRFINDAVTFTTFTVQPDWKNNQFHSGTVVEIKSLDSADWSLSRDRPIP